MKTGKPQKKDASKTLFIKDAEYDSLYATIPTGKGLEGVNPTFHPTPMMIKLIEKPVTPNGGCKVETYSHLQRAWLPLTMPGHIVVSADIGVIPAREHPREVEIVEGVVKISKAKRVAARAARPEAPKPPADGVKVIASVIGSTKSLYDASTFDLIALIPAGQKPADAAKKLKRVLVPYADASHYCKCQRAKAWRKAFLLGGK